MFGGSPVLAAGVTTAALAPDPVASSCMSEAESLSRLPQLPAPAPLPLTAATVVSVREHDSREAGLDDCFRCRTY